MRRLMFLLGAAFAGLTLCPVRAAQGAIPVIFEDTDEDPGAILERVSERTGLPTDQLKATPIDLLLEMPPRVIGGAVLRNCARNATEMVEVRNEVTRAEAQWRDVNPQGAMDRLDLAVSKAGCLTELADRKVLARMFLLRGGLLALDGQPVRAQEEMRSALAFDPNLSWDVGFPFEGEAAFESARAEESTLTISVQPGASSAGPWIDGRTVTAESAAGGLHVGKGLHLVQTTSTAGFQTAWVVAASDAVLVVPQRYRQPVLENMRSATDQRQVSALVQATIDDFQAAYVAGLGGMWLIAPEAITELVPPTPIADPESKRRWWWPFGRKKKKTT